MKPQILIIHYIDGARDVLQVDVDFSPHVFIRDNVLNVRGRLSTMFHGVVPITDCEHQWHYFPLCNIRRYHMQDGEPV